MCTLFGVVTVMGEVVLSGLLVNDVVVAVGRFLGSERVRGVGRSIDVFALPWGCVAREEGDCLIDVLACLL